MDSGRVPQPESAFDYGARVDKWARETLTEHVREQDREQRFEPECLAKLRESGLLSLELAQFLPGAPQALLSPGSGDLGKVAAAIRMLSRTDPSVAVLVHVHNVLAVRCIMRFGTAAQKSRWLPRLGQDCIGAFATTEPQAGSDLSRLTSRADLRGDKLLLNGRKHWITNAREAGVFVAFATFEGDGVVALIVAADTPGVRIGPQIDKMSMRASSTCPVEFREVVLDPEHALLNGRRGGMDVALYGLVCGRIGIAAQMLGLAEGAHERAVSYARTRKAFGTAIFNHQGVSLPLAQIAAEMTAVELLIAEALRTLESSRSHMSAMDVANKAKLIAAQVAGRSASVAVEVLGGNGVAEGFEVEKFFRDAKVGSIYEGTENILLCALSHGLYGTR